MCALQNVLWCPLIWVLLPYIYFPQHTVSIQNIPKIHGSAEQSMLCGQCSEEHPLHWFALHCIAVYCNIALCHCIALYCISLLLCIGASAAVRFRLDLVAGGTSETDQLKTWLRTPKSTIIISSSKCLMNLFEHQLVTKVIARWT